MKKLIALGATLLMTLAACGSGARAKTNRVAFVGMPGINAYFTEMQTEFTKQFAAEGQDAKRVNGSFNPAEQVSQAELYLDDDPDYLFIWPNNPDTMKNVVKKAHDQGTKIISFVEEIEDSDAYVVTDPRELAGQSAQIASKWIDTVWANAAAGTVKVAVVYDSSKTNVVWQAESMRDTIKQNTKVNSDVAFVACEEGTDKGKSWADLYLVDHHIDVVLSPNCSTSMGISNSMLADASRNKGQSGIFTVNIQSEEDIAKVATSKTNACLVRGGANAGNGAAGTIADFVKVWKGIEAGTLEKGYKQMSENTFMYEDQFRGSVDQINFNA